MPVALVVVGWCNSSSAATLWLVVFPLKDGCSAQHSPVFCCWLSQCQFSRLLAIRWGIRHQQRNNIDRIGRHGSFALLWRCYLDRAANGDVAASISECEYLCGIATPRRRLFFRHRRRSFHPSHVSPRVPRLFSQMAYRREKNLGWDILCALIVAGPSAWLIWKDPEEVFQYVIGRRQVVAAIGLLPYHIYDIGTHLSYSVLGRMGVGNPERQRVLRFLERCANKNRLRHGSMRLPRAEMLSLSKQKRSTRFRSILLFWGSRFAEAFRVCQRKPRLRQFLRSDLRRGHGGRRIYRFAVIASHIRGRRCHAIPHEPVLRSSGYPRSRRLSDLCSDRCLRGVLEHARDASATRVSALLF